jgi:hypothetical protein
MVPAHNLNHPNTKEVLMKMRVNNMKMRVNNTNTLAHVSTYLPILSLCTMLRPRSCTSA